MGQEFNDIAIIGSGASGSVCAYYLLKSGLKVTLFDKSAPLRTLLPTGGGRCNLAHAIFDFKDLAKNYPRGEKFLYSVFSRFSTSDTLNMFEEMGVKTYTQPDGRIFPQGDSSKFVRERILKNIQGAKFVKEEILALSPVPEGFKLKGAKSEYYFKRVVVAVGGHSGYGLLKDFDINIIEPKPSLTGLCTDTDFSAASGVTVKNAVCGGLRGDILFTHFGISGPLVFKISSVNARRDFPYTIELDLVPQLGGLQEILNSNPHKEIKNILSDYLPSRLVESLLSGIDIKQKAHEVNGITRDEISNRLHKLKINLTGTNKGEEIVTSGGVDLAEINSKNMELKKVPNLYCIGEVLDIDGFCGGFNLQNAWSDGFVAANGIINTSY